MGKRAKKLLANLSLNRPTSIPEVTGQTLWPAIPKTIKADKLINPELPVRNRRGDHVVLVSMDERYQWAIRARVNRPGHYINSFTKTGAFLTEQAANELDLFNVTLEEFQKRFPKEKVK